MRRRGPDEYQIMEREVRTRESATIYPSGHKRRCGDFI